MDHIRPHQALGLFKTQYFYERMSSIVLPDKFTGNALETCILIALARHVDVKTYFEFGTFRGVNTLNIAANISGEAEIYTLDLDAESFQSSQQHENDKAISEEHFNFMEKLAFLNTPYEKQIFQLFGDSRTFNFDPYHSRVNMVYIDGGHDLQTVRSDTINAFKMLDKNRAGCIAWHDYGNKTYPELTGFLDEQSAKYDLKHVEETRIVFFLQYPD